MIYKRTEELGSGHIDASCGLSASGAFILVEEAITRLLGMMELDGFSLQRKYDATWVFVKNRMKLMGKIAWNEQYHLTSFISRIARGAIWIDTVIENSNKEICVYARVELCAINLSENKLKKMAEVGMDETIEVVEPWIDFNFTRFAKMDYDKVGEVKVKYSNIDFLKHTNNKEYIRFILDTYSVDELLQKPVREIEIAYMNQSHEGDTLTISKTVSNGAELFIVNNSDQVIVKCEILR